MRKIGSIKTKTTNRNQRLVSLDVFRGVTIAMMIIVNSPGNSTPYAWLMHSRWNGCTLADVVFPFFIVILGISSVFSLSNLKAMGVSSQRLLGKILKRSGYIFLMGLLLNAIPHFDLYTLRILGVLQRIAICYLFSACLFLTTRIQVQVALMLVIILGYGCLMAYTPLSLDGNIVGFLDQLVLSPAHLYTPVFDPEGLLSTIPALGSVLLGNICGVYLISSRTHQQKLRWMSLIGVMLVCLGYLWGYILPINKSLWSSSYVLVTGGMALLAFAVLYCLIEVKHWIRWSKPFALFGRHAMLVYMLHVIFLKIQALIFVHNKVGAIVNLRLYLTEMLFGNFIPQNAALCYALSYLFIWFWVIKFSDA
jgi:predicted acyltransferase|tara:strand:+ start:1607 stop:2701 length:1095 start_codon:yes stop_codon:yes gene_type:complete